MREWKDRDKVVWLLLENILNIQNYITFSQN